MHMYVWEDKAKLFEFSFEETVQSGNFWSSAWEGRRPWIDFLMMNSFRKVEEDGTRVERTLSLKEMDTENYTIKKIKE